MVPQETSSKNGWSFFHPILKLPKGTRWPDVLSQCPFFFFSPHLYKFVLLQVLFLILWWLTACMCDVRFAFYDTLSPCSTWQQPWEGTEWEWKLRRQNKKLFFFLNNINHKPLKRLPFIQTPLSAWGHWEQGNHSSSRSSSDLRKPMWLSHRLGNYSRWKISLRNVQRERASCSALWNLPSTRSLLCWG